MYKKMETHHRRKNVQQMFRIIQNAGIFTYLWKDLSLKKSLGRFFIFKMLVRLKKISAFLTFTQKIGWLLMFSACICTFSSHPIGQCSQVG